MRPLFICRWVEKGKFILLERDKNLLRLYRGLDVPHQGKLIEEL